jgi:putative ABC transport system substrate-binding protein
MGLKSTELAKKPSVLHQGSSIIPEFSRHTAARPQFDRLPSLMADLVRRRLAVIATPGGNLAAQAAKAATTTNPIDFGVGEDAVKLGLVASLARPGSNATGINFFAQEVSAKRFQLLHELVPTAVRTAVLVRENIQAANLDRRQRTR